MSDSKYLRQLGTHLVTVRDAKRDTPSPIAGRIADIVVLESEDGRLIDAKFGIDPRTGNHFPQAVDALNALKFACGCSGRPAKDCIGKQLIILVEPKDGNGKRYWNVTRFWPASEWLDDDFGGGF